MYLTEPAINLFSADVNGDGKMDLLEGWNEQGTGTLFLMPLRSVGTTFAAGTWFDTGMPIRDGPYEQSELLLDQVVPMDINGDGLTDVVTVDKSLVGPDVTLVPFFSNGAGFMKGAPYSPTSGWMFPFGPYGGPFLARVVPMDVNGDGKMDLTQVFVTGYDPMLLLQPVRSTGTGFVSSNWYHTNQRADTAMTYEMDSMGEPLLTSADGPSEVFVDFTGDGKSDMVQLKYTEGSGSLSVLGYASDGQLGSLVDSMTDGLGASIHVSYKPLTDSSVYTRDSTAVYPIVDMQTSQYVVASVRSANGNGGLRTVNHTYGGMKGDLTRRNWAGFRWREAQQVDTGIVTRTEFRQDWPYWGMPSLTQQRLRGAGNGGLLSQTLMSYGCTDFVSASGCASAPGRRYFAAPSQVVQSGWDLNGAALPWVTTTMQYDAWGNPTQVTVETNAFRKTVVNTYLNNTTHWFIGRVTSSTVTSTVQ
jgi:hypothetical protein